MYGTMTSLKLILVISVIVITINTVSNYSFICRTLHSSVRSLPLFVTYNFVEKYTEIHSIQL